MDELETPPQARAAPGMGVADQVAFLSTILESSTEYSIVAKDLDGLILAWTFTPTLARTAPAAGGPA